MNSLARPEIESLSGLGKTVLQPGLIWACRTSGAQTELIDGGEPPTDDCAFRWLHLNLADQRSLSWLERSVSLPPAILRMFISPEAEQRGRIEGGYVALILHDFERDFDWLDTGRIGALHIVAGPGIMLTGRFHPLHTADVIRERIVTGGAIADSGAALLLVLDALSDTFQGRTLRITQGLIAVEDELLSDRASPDSRELITMRRLCTQLHRTMAAMRTLLLRLESEQALPPSLLPSMGHASQRLHMLDQDIGAAQTQLCLLRDELDLQAAQRTNRNIYFLSVMTALLMPATLVTGFFGMNTGGMPLAQGVNGTSFAALIALLSSVATYFALRQMGFVRE